MGLFIAFLLVLGIGFALGRVGVQGIIKETVDAVHRSKEIEQRIVDTVRTVASEVKAKL